MEAAQEKQLLLEDAQPLWIDTTGDLSKRVIPSRQEILQLKERLRALLENEPGNAIAHNNLGWAEQISGENAGVIDHFRKALELDPELRVARRNLSTLLVSLNRRDEAVSLIRKEIDADENGLVWLLDLISNAMRCGKLQLAGDYAAILARLRWGTKWYPPKRMGDSEPVRPVRVPPVFLTVKKLEHDIAQFEYLQRKGVLGNEFEDICGEYRKIISRLSKHEKNARQPLTREDHQAIGHVYNRIVHIRDTPRVGRALSASWDPAQVEECYKRRPLGLVIIDHFLSEDALESLRLFCLESTVWSANRYANGRLGAFFHDGFNCPLLIQIAEELRQALPRIILDRYPLRQVWGFKNAALLPPGSTTHADFAAVNVNFWITPEEANLDKTSGGLVVYDVDAPLTWDFATYNGRNDIIKSFLKQVGAREIYIPYRQNRAIIFNSDLFHASAGVQFRDTYEDRRINVTMLYGDRENDVHHRQLADRKLSGLFPIAPAWRSGAFSLSRRLSS